MSKLENNLKNPLLIDTMDQKMNMTMCFIMLKRNHTDGYDEIREWLIDLVGFAYGEGFKDSADVYKDKAMEVFVDVLS